MHILLTGASSGIGESLARYWGDQPVKLTLAARSEEKLNELAGELKCETFVQRADLNDLAECPRLIEAATAAFGPIDVLVNNAGIQYIEPTVGVSAERLDRLFTVDLLSPFHLIRLVLPDMLARRSGTIVNVSSMAGITHTPGMTHYNAAKAGLAAGSESLRVELRKQGVHVVTVYPGPVATPMEVEGRKKYHATLAARLAPTGKPEVLARLVDTAMRRKKARVIYPRVYTVARYSRVLAQWVTDIGTPPLMIEEQ